MDSTKLVERLTKRLRKTFGGWSSREHAIRTFLDQPIDRLTRFVNTGDDDVLVDMELSRLQTWHYTNFAATALTQGVHAADELGLATSYAMWTVLCGEPLSRQDRGGDLLKDTAAFYFALQFIANRQPEAIAVGDALLEGMDTPLLDLRKNDRHDAGSLFPHFWFLMHLYSSMRGYDPIDVSMYSYPESLGPYSEVLRDWRTSDTNQVREWVELMAEHHVQRTDDSDKYSKNEFDNDDAKLFPYEIFAFLRVREWLKLPNPATFEHPLLNQSLGRMPAPLPPQPQDKLLTQVIEQYRKYFPDLRAV